MAGPTTQLAARRVRKLGTRKPTVTIGEDDKAPGTWMGRRLLRVNGSDAFELSFWCGTCPFLFERLEKATDRTASIPHLERALNEGLSAIDETVIDAFSTLLPKGKYLPMLLEIEPTLVEPGQPGDYFAEEQLATWRDYEGPGIPQNPRTPYYRADSRQLDGDNRLFEFVVPMVPPSWNERDRVDAHAQRLRTSTRPTCVAVGVLDVRRQAVFDTPEEGLIHWGLAHFLLDGHHKIEAASASGSRLQMLSLISLDASLAERHQIERLASIFERSGR